MIPDEYTNQEFFLEVGDGHQLYVHDWGNKKSKSPMIFLHGGPGAHCKEGHRQNFDPQQHRVIFFDQRASGRSLPYGSLEHNTTQHLIADINKIAEHYKLKQFVLVGGSWGSCLALAYAVAHPKRVKALVLSGIFTGSRAELDWIEQGRFRSFYPEVWEAYLSRTPKKHHHDPTAYHYKNILAGGDSAMHKSAYALSELEGSVMSLDDRITPRDPIEFDPTSTRIFTHYATNNCFLPDRHIFKNAGKLTMPIWLVQGRYDMDCPPITAHELHKAIPHSKLIWTIANHRGNERETATALKAILMQFS